MEIYEDSVVGKVTLSHSAKAKKIGLKVRPDGEVVLVVPHGISVGRAVDFLKSKYDWVLSHTVNRSKIIYDETTNFETLTFKLFVRRGDDENCRFCLERGELYVYYPHSCDVRSDDVQSLIKLGIEKALKSEAKRILPTRLEMLSKMFGFKFESVKIQGSHTRWGSCSGRKNINLSCYLLMLPIQLVDYVLLHELCHTAEMNHSDKFWKLMDNVTDGRAKSLRTELKNYSATL